MKKILLLIVLMLLSCESNSIKEEESPIVLTAEQKLKELLIKTIKPLFKAYEEVAIPNKFRIDENDNSINAGAAANYLEVSKGLVNYKKEAIQVFVLAHEISHIVMLSQAKKIMLPTPLVSGSITNDYKKAEYLADLIAIHLINVQKPKLSKELELNFELLETLLGSETFTHPGAKERVNRMKQYLSAEKVNTASNAFKEMFEEIWSMN